VYRYKDTVRAVPRRSNDLRPIQGGMEHAVLQEHEALEHTFSSASFLLVTSANFCRCVVFAFSRLCTLATLSDMATRFTSS
jgi:hypothetical protein